VRRALALVDGEHYAPVVRDALASLEDEVVAALLVGGTEKLRGGEDYGVPLRECVEAAIAELTPEVVLDLSDEPVLGPVERFRLASRVLAAGIAYEGADFRLAPVSFARVDAAALAVCGTGKRVGKTAVTGYLARRLSRERRVVVVAMGRGGPRVPEAITVRPTVDALVQLSRAGRHAASDHLETAAVAGVETIGCRRCGGGLAGAVVTSNVLEGARIAARLDPELVVFDGSGAALPPVDVARRILVVGAHQDRAVATGYLNAYRLLLADLVIVTMAEESAPHAAITADVRALVRAGVPVVRTVLRPRPIEPVIGERVAYFGTAPAAQHPRIAEELGDVHGAHVAHVSGALADRARLRAELSDLVADTFVVELKAAAIDVVVEEAVRRDVRVVIAANDVVALPGEPDLDAELQRLAAEAVTAVPTGVGT
jgi:cyclic 2,3-diphosphoglycerate synthetase